MEPIILVLIGITLLFFIILAVKSILKAQKPCAICVSVSLTWIALLILYFLENFSDKNIIAILMGQTSLGIYYMLEKKVKKNKLVFRLPLLLTFIFIIYSILESFIFNGILFLLVLWAIFFMIYLFKNNKIAKKIIECCKKW